MEASKTKVGAALLLAFIAGLGVMWLTVDSGRDGRARERVAGKQVTLMVSPDKAYTAKIWLPGLDGLGATISQPHQVWIQSQAGESRLMLEADKTDQIKVRWLGARLLEVCYGDAQINTFHNRFIDVDRTGPVTQVQTVEVALRRVARLDECGP